MRFFNQDGTFKGELIDGIFQPVSPAPTGDDFDELWDNSCLAIEHHPALRDKLNHMLRFDRQHNRHSTWLGEIVAKWITVGNLRDLQQVNRAASQYADHWNRLVRLNAIQNWELNLASLEGFGGLFGIVGGKPLPSKQELLAQQAEMNLRNAERIAKTSRDRREENNKMHAYEAELDRKTHVLEFTKNRSRRLFPCPDDFISGDGDITENGKSWLELVRGYEVAIRHQVRHAVERGMDDDEIEKYIDRLEREENMGTPDYDDAAYLVPSGEPSPELKDGEYRLTFADRRELLAELADHAKWDKILDTQSFIVRATHSGFEIDVVEKIEVEEAA